MAKNTKKNWNKPEKKIVAGKPGIMRVRCTFVQEVLGTKPADPEIYAKFIAQNAPDAESRKEEIARLGKDEYKDQTITVFLRDPYTALCCIQSYMMYGNLEASAKSLRYNGNKLANISAYQQKMKAGIHVYPRWIDIEGKTPHLKFWDDESGEEVAEDAYNMNVNERPLRAETMQGPRVALAASEQIPPCTYFDVKIECETQAMWDLVVECLNYGLKRGIGQWRNAGHGSYVWDMFDSKGNIIGGNRTAFPASVDELMGLPQDLKDTIGIVVVDDTEDEDDEEAAEE